MWLVTKKKKIHFYEWSEEVALNFLCKTEAGGWSPILPLPLWNGISLLVCSGQDRCDKYDRTDVTGH